MTKQSKEKSANLLIWEMKQCMYLIIMGYYKKYQEILGNTIVSQSYHINWCSTAVCCLSLHCTETYAQQPCKQSEGSFNLYF